MHKFMEAKPSSYGICGGNNITITGDCDENDLEKYVSCRFVRMSEFGHVELLVRMTRSC